MMTNLSVLEILRWTCVCVVPAQSSEAKCGHMGAAITQSDAKASSNSTLCRTTRDEACCDKRAKKTIKSSEGSINHLDFQA